MFILYRSAAGLKASLTSMEDGASTTEKLTTTGSLISHRIGGMLTAVTTAAVTVTGTLEDEKDAQQKRENHQ